MCWFIRYMGSLLSIILLFTSYWLPFKHSAGVCAPPWGRICSEYLLSSPRYYHELAQTQKCTFSQVHCSFSVLSLWMDVKSGWQINYWKAMSPLSCFCSHQKRHISSSFAHTENKTRYIKTQEGLYVHLEEARKSVLFSVTERERSRRASVKGKRQ